MEKKTQDNKLSLSDGMQQAFKAELMAYFLIDKRAKV